MASLAWHTKAHVTTAETCRLFSYFSSLGQVIAFRATKRPLIGATGQGFVSFQDPQVVNNLLNGKESNTIYLSPGLKTRIEDETIDAIKNNTQESSNANNESSDSTQGTLSTPGKTKRYQVLLLKDLKKTPEEASIDAQLLRRNLRIVREEELFRRFIDTELSAVNRYRNNSTMQSQVNGILTETVEKMKALEARRNASNKGLGDSIPAYKGREQRDNSPDSQA